LTVFHNIALTIIIRLGDYLGKNNNTCLLQNEFLFTQTNNTINTLKLYILIHVVEKYVSNKKNIEVIKMSLEVI